MHPVTSLRSVRKRGGERENERKQTAKGLTEAEKHHIQTECFFWKTPQRGAVQIFVRRSENKRRNGATLSGSQRCTDKVYEKNNKH